MFQKYAGIYTRVSTSSQEENGTSLDSQVERCLEAAKAEGYQVEPRYIWREQFTGTTMNRPQLQQMRDAVRFHEVDAAFVYASDRLSRDPLHLTILNRECKDAGVDLIYLTGVQGDSDLIEVMRFLEGYTAQAEREKILERCTRGRIQTAKSGRMPSFSIVYGYRYNRLTRRYETEEAEAETVRKIFDWAFHGMSPYGIACRLNNAKIPTKKGAQWRGQGVKDLLKNDLYTGTHQFGRETQRKNGDRTEYTRNPKEAWIPIPDAAPVLVSQALYDAVQKRLPVQQARVSRTKPRLQYLLTGYISCACCGKAVVGTASPKRIQYYRCQAARPRNDRARTCQEPSIRADCLELAVWNKVTEAIRNPAILTRDLREHLETGTGDLSSKMAEIRKELRQLESRRNKLIEIYERDLIDLDTLETKLTPLNNLRDEKKETLADLEDLQRRREDVDDISQHIVEHCGKLSEALNRMDFESKRGTLAAFNVKVKATRNDLEIQVAVAPDVLTISDGLYPAIAPSVRFNFPRIIAPASFNRRTTVPSKSGTKSRSTCNPPVVATPVVKHKSLTAMGTPCSAPRYRPSAISSSAA